MYNLFLDTSNKNIYLAIFTDKKNILYKYTILNIVKISEIIINEIKNFLHAHKIKNEEIEKIYLTTGPGSFNGVRIGCIIAKTWTLIYPNCKTYIINSLRLKTNSKKCISILNCNQKKKYVGIFNDLKTKENYFVYTNEQIDKLISKKDNYCICADEINENIYDYLIKNLKYFKKIKSEKI